MSGKPPADRTSAAHAWRYSQHPDVCDSIEPWAHGTIYRASCYPDHWLFNAVRIEDGADLSAEQLTEIADTALAGLAHRRLDFDVAEAAEPIRRELETRGWQGTRLIWLRHSGAPPGAGELRPTLARLAPRDVDALRIAWHQEDFAITPAPRYLRQAEEVAALRDLTVLAALEDGVPIAYVQLEAAGESAEITQLYVRPGSRRAGLGTAMIRAAIGLAEAKVIWICTDDEDRAKDLYMRLGFEPVTTTLELQLPQAGR